MKRILERLFGWAGRAPAPQPAPPASANEIATPAEDPIALMRERIESEVASGFYDEDVILKNLPEHFEDEIDPAAVRREAPRLLRAVLAAHAAAEANWPAITDCDRLDAAFEALEAKGIVARHNFTCCMTCGSAEIGEEIAAAQAIGVPAYGYAFYHMQDTDSAVAGGGIYIAYGALEEGEAAALDVAREIVSTLEAHGLETEWDGSWDRRIGVPLLWQRRRGAVHSTLTF